MPHKYRVIGAALAVIILLVACTRAQQRSSPGDEVCSGTKCTSLEKLSEMISMQLDDRVVGYVAIVGSRIIERGQARTFANPPLRAMTADVPIGIASIGKMFTTVAAMKLLEQHDLSIDATIWPYLPSGWTKGPGVDTITFRELLTHRAGFRHNSNDVFHDDDAARRQIEDGVQLASKDIPEYNNLNFAIFRELLPALAGVADPGPARRSAAYSQAFENIIGREVFDPLGITDATCDGPAVTPPAVLYRTMVDDTAADPKGTEMPPGPAACAAGGWITSAGSLHLFAADLASGGKLLSGRQKQLMDKNCLGWDCSVFSQPDYRGKSGNFNLYNAELSAFVGVFGKKIPVVLVMNSRPPAPPSEIAYDSFITATR